MQKRKRKQVDKEEENSETLQRMNIGRVGKKSVDTCTQEQGNNC